MGPTCAKCGLAAEELISEGGQLVCWPWCGSEDSLRDARLIAAAPDLLGACRLLLSFFGPEERYQNAETLRQTLDAARAAVAKATGEADRG